MHPRSIEGVIASRLPNEPRGSARTDDRRLINGIFPDHAIGRSREGLSTKINVLVGEQGLPLRSSRRWPSLRQGGRGYFDRGIATGSRLHRSQGASSPPARFNQTLA